MASELLKIELSKIRSNPIALRDSNKTSLEFQELVASIRAGGVNNPIVVRRKIGEDGKEFELVDGLQRFSASQEAGSGIVGEVGVIPANVIEREDADALLTQIIGNAHRIETKPADYAKGLMRILGYYPTMTEGELAAKLNKGPAWINKQMQLLKLHDSVKPLVNDGKIVLANAYVMSKLPPEEQLVWLERAQTTPANEFSAAVLERVKAIRDANRKGTSPGEETFVAVPHLRKKNEIEKEMETPEILPAMARDLNLLEGVQVSKSGLQEATKRGIVLALQWAASYDPKSQEASKAKWEDRKKHENEQRIRRDAEKKETRAKELEEKGKKAAEEAAKAREEAAKLPASEAVPV